MRFRFIAFVLSCSLIIAFIACEKDSDDSSSTSTSSQSVAKEDCIVQNIMNETVTFSSNCYSANDQLSWDFGDGNSSMDSIVSHTYSDTGNYTVSLSIKRGNSTLNYSESVRIEPSCKICSCRFPLDTVNSTFSYCGTSVQANSWCSTNCTNNQFCSSCRDL